MHTKTPHHAMTVLPSYYVTAFFYLLYLPIN